MKYAALVAVAVWLAVVLWIGGLVARNDSAVRFIVPPAPVADTAALQADTLRARQAIATIDPLRRSQLAAAASPSFIAAAPESAAKAADAATSNSAGADEEVAPLPSRQVSLIYYAPGFRRAIIDDAYVRIDSRLPDGARVVDITADAVILRDRFGRHVIKPARDDTAFAGPRAQVTR